LAWKKSSPELSSLLEKTLEDALKGKSFQKRKMFGCPAYFVNDNMFSTVHQDNLVIRLSEDGRRDIMLKYDESENFEPMKGRIMKEYMVLPESLYSDQKELDHWLNRAYEYASSLPQKKKKNKANSKS
jgi:TfoX/Sxy family transcriptional regulator of competence genes